MPDDIILIGPIGTGKSTQGKLLSERLGLPQIRVDRVKWTYYEEMGFDREFDEMLGNQGGRWARYQYWKAFECAAIERILADHSDFVIDFGGGHSVYENPEQFDRVQKALEPYPNVVLILPCPDEVEAMDILLERKNRHRVDGQLDLNEHFIRHPSNEKLAKHTIYTKDKSPEYTRDEILALVK